MKDDRSKNREARQSTHLDPEKSQGKHVAARPSKRNEFNTKPLPPSKAAVKETTTHENHEKDASSTSQSKQLEAESSKDERRFHQGKTAELKARMARSSFGNALTAEKNRKQRQLDSAQQLAAATEQLSMTTSGTMCVICCEPIAYYALGVCEHRGVCHICCLRLRALYKSDACSLCKTPLDKIIITSDAEKPFSVLSEHAYSALPSLKALSMYCDSPAIGNELHLMLQIQCPHKTCLARDSNIFSNISALRHHLRETHHCDVCDICVTHKKVFSREQRLYTHSQMAIHLREGDAHVDDPLFHGHPRCTLCHANQYSLDDLTDHCRQSHEMCHICAQQGDPHVYFRNYTSLESHFDQSHYLCSEKVCMETKFVVFGSALDLQVHQAEVHRGEKLKIDVRALAYDPQRYEKKPSSRNTLDVMRLGDLLKKERGHASSNHQSLLQAHQSRFPHMRRDTAGNNTDRYSATHSQTLPSTVPTVAVAASVSNDRHEAFPALPSASSDVAKATTAVNRKIAPSRMSDAVRLSSLSSTSSGAAAFPTLQSVSKGFSARKDTYIDHPSNNKNRPSNHNNSTIPVATKNIASNAGPVSMADQLATHHRQDAQGKHAQRWSSSTVINIAASMSKSLPSQSSSQDAISTIKKLLKPQEMCFFEFREASLAYRQKRLSAESFLVVLENIAKDRGDTLKTLVYTLAGLLPEETLVDQLLEVYRESAMMRQGEMETTSVNDKQKETVREREQQPSLESNSSHNRHHAAGDPSSKEVPSSLPPVRKAKVLVLPKREKGRENTTNRRYLVEKTQPTGKWCDVCGQVIPYLDYDLHMAGHETATVNIESDHVDVISGPIVSQQSETAPSLPVSQKSETPFARMLRLREEEKSTGKESSGEARRGTEEEQTAVSTTSDVSAAGQSSKQRRQKQVLLKFG